MNNVVSFAQVLKRARSEESPIEALPTICDQCAHLSPDSPVKCDAFPAGIPLGVLVGAFDHHESYPGDNGIVFDPKEGYVKKADISHVPRDAHGRWTKIGNQLGSNRGGVYEHQGVRHYVKFPRHSEQARAEQAADGVYELLGVQTMQHKATQIEGDLGSVSKWRHVDILGHDGWRQLDSRQKQQAANAFVASALTKNWDVVGQVYDNMGKDKNGNLAIMDTGGSFHFRAQGSHKDFGTDAHVEIEAMLNPSKTSGRVFGPLMDANPEVFIRAARRLKMTADVSLTKPLKDAGLESMAPALLARKKAILEYFHV